MSVTIHTVAKRAGVSPSTVSRALNTPSLVSTVSRQRVEEAAAELGYRPNRAARGLITGRMGMVGLVVPDITNPFYPTLVRAAEHAAHANNLALLLADTNETPDAEEDLVRDMSRLVDGIILCSSRMSSDQFGRIDAFKEECPVVSVNRPIAGSSSIVLDSAAGMTRALRHLADLGHTRVAYAAGPPQAWANAQRLQGLGVAASLGIEVIHLATSGPRFEGGEEVVPSVLEANVTAVIAYNDLIALGLLSGLHSRAVPVPEAISVIGFDDIFPARIASPALTTVAMPSDEAGRRAVELLAKRLSAAGTGNRRITIATTLVVRASTGPAMATQSGRSPPPRVGNATAGLEAAPSRWWTRQSEKVASGRQSSAGGEERVQ